MVYVNMAAGRILVVEDEPDIAELISYNLGKEGFNAATALDGEQALSRIGHESFDLIVLDLMLPGIQGTELCRIIRNTPKTKALPIIMLTAKSEEVDKIVGLEMGADDYITKPFSPRELVARIRAVLRRAAEKGRKENVVRFGELTVDLSAYTVTKGKTPMSLSPTEFRLLAYLIENKGRVFDRDQLLSAVWKDEGYVEPRTVDVHIRRLRAQIEDDPAYPVYIKTRRGIGYCANTDL
jgi:phosphate regulon transcriptional regulator PhoB